MDSNYQFVLQRLREERERWNLTQRLLCYYMKMQQSHFSKAETGHRRFSYHELKGLCTTNVDVFYIFTGKKAENIYEFLEPLKTSPEEIICHLNTVYLLVSTALLTNRSKTSFRQVQKQLEYIRYGIGNITTQNSIFYYMREQYRYTQQKMADILGVDIKKLRGLEKEKQLPDSEIIWKMYNRFQISPAFILKDSKGLWNELNYALGLMENGDREIILQILKSGHKLVDGKQF